MNADERLRELAVQMTIHLSSVLRVGAVYDLGNLAVRLQVDKLEATLREILLLVPDATLAALEADLYLNHVRVPNRASQYKFLRTVLDEFARRKMAGISIAPGFERQELDQFLGDFMRPNATGPGLLEACSQRAEYRIVPVLLGSPATIEGAVEFEVGADPLWDGTERESHPSQIRHLGATPELATESLKGTRALFLAAFMEDLEFRHAKRLVQPIVDAAYTDEPLFIGLTSDLHDQYPFVHAVNVCSIACSIGRVLGIERRALADLAVAALFHDIGKSAVDDPGSVPPGDAVHQHATEGAKVLARSTALHPSTLRSVQVALDHHRVPGPAEASGPPNALGQRPMGVLSQIVAVADTFVSFRMHRSERGQRITPHQAMSLALAECRGKFEDALSWALVRAAGIYPLGQVVEMDDGALAIVVSVNGADPSRPGVQVIRDAAGTVFSPAAAPVLRPLPVGRNLRRALSIEEYPAEQVPAEATRTAA